MHVETIRPITRILNIAAPFVIMLQTSLLIFYRYKLTQYKMRDARAAADALVGFVKIDGMTLPLPSDERWKFETVSSSKSKTLRVLVLGIVIVEDDGTVYMSTNPGVPAPACLPTKALQEWAASVWREARSRAVRQSVTG